jgi:TRAP-type C4-dicarboxylate transport system substrate-binding protein
MVAGDTRLTRRQMVRLLGLGTSTAILAGCAQSTAPAPAAPSKQTYAMKIGTATLNDVQHEWCKRYKARLEARTNGQITADVFPASQLGSIPRMIEGVQLGTIEAWMGPPDFLVGLESRCMVPGMPLLFRDQEEAFKVFSDQRLLDRFLALTEDKGIKGVSLVIYGPMVLFSRTPVRTPDDARGKKYRIFAAPTEIETMNAFGATGVPITLGEVTGAISSGTVDGAQSGITVGDTFKWYDLVKYCTESHHAMITSFGGVSKSWYDRLPAELQRAVVEEARALHQELFDWQKQELVKSSQTWDEQTQGGLFRLTEQERDVFRQRLAGVPERVLEQRPEIRETLEMFQAKVREVRA